jgi:serine/threonine-protein kinase
VHRDIKPNNLFLHTEAKGARLLKVLDFGIARVLPNASRTAPLPLEIPTETGAVLGAPRFSSPEAAVGQRVDERADVYGAGLVLYAMLAGRDPFRHIQNEQMLLSAHAVEDPEPPSKFAREPIPPALDVAVLRALQKDPQQRYQSARDFEEELRGLAGRLQRPAGWVETTSFDIPADQVLPPDSSPTSGRAARRLTSEPDPSEPARREPVKPPTPVPTLTLDDAAAAGYGVKSPARSRAWVSWLVFLVAVVAAAAVGAGGVSALRVFMGEP